MAMSAKELLESVMLPDDLLDDEPKCAREGCDETAAWTGRPRCRHPLRACEGHHEVLVTGGAAGATCKCGVRTFASGILWTRL